MQNDQKQTIAELLGETLLGLIELNPKQPLVSYVKAREAIEVALPDREQKRQAKMRVVQYLGGSKHPGLKRGKEQLPSYVLFKCEDGKERKATF